jgi:hypothetical protein
LAGQTVKGNGFGVQPRTKKLAVDVDTSVIVTVIQTNQNIIKEFQIVSFSGFTCCSGSEFNGEPDYNDDDPVK